MFVNRFVRRAGRVGACRTSGPRSDPREGEVRRRRELDLDRASGDHGSTAGDDAHDPGESDDPALVIGPDQLLEQARLKAVDLLAGVAQARDRHHRITEAQSSADGKRQHVDSPSRDVLAELTGCDIVSARAQFVEQLFRDQMNLSQIRLRGVCSYP